MRLPAAGPIHTQLALPLLYAGQATGVMTLYYQEPRPFTADEIGLAQSFANQAANALENARLFAELRAMYAHRKADRRDSAKQPAAGLCRPQVGVIEFAHEYQAALEEAVIGGDFFDLFPLGEDRMGLVMADVSGKGLKAAVQTAMLKYTLRGFALENPGRARPCPGPRQRRFVQPDEQPRRLCDPLLRRPEHAHRRNRLCQRRPRAAPSASRRHRRCRWS